MENTTVSFALMGVVPAVCDAEAGQALSVPQIRSVMVELCSAIRSALDDERGTAEDSLRRAATILQGMGETEPTSKEEVRGGLSPWQVRKVTSHVDAHLDRPIRNENLALIAQLTPSHFGRAFRNSFGEPPHEYVIRRRVERAQGLMLSTDAPLSAIALDCGMADQAHLSRLFRRIVGEAPGTWRRARRPAGCSDPLQVSADVVKNRLRDCIRMPPNLIGEDSHKSESAGDRA